MYFAIVPASANLKRRLRSARSSCIAPLLLSLLVSSAHIQHALANGQAVPTTNDNTDTSVITVSKVDETVKFLTTFGVADLALNAAVLAADCQRAEPVCAPLVVAQNVILAPWNFLKLLRLLQEPPDPDFTTIFRPRDYPSPSLIPAAGLPAEMMSLAEHTLEQQVALYELVEAWQVTMERHNTAVASNDQSAAAAQARALQGYSSQVSTAAAGLNAASFQLLESLTPLIRPLASPLAVEAVEGAKADRQGRGFGPDLQESFSAMGIPQADVDALLAEVLAVDIDSPLDVLENLIAVIEGYDDLADLTTVPADAAVNSRPVAHAGPDQTVSAGDADYASVVLDGGGSTDPDGDVLEHLWTGAFINVSGSRPTINLPPGTHHIVLTVADRKDGTDRDLVTITVGDTAAPLITELTATPDVLWPPSQKLVRVELGVKVVDNDDPMPVCQVVSVGVNEPATAAGDGSAEPDMVFDGSLALLLRAEPSAGGAARIYSVTVQCTDKLNHSSFRSTFVSVPHDRGQW